MSTNFGEKREEFVAPAIDADSTLESIKKANKEFNQLQRKTKYDPITSFERTSVWPKLVFAGWSSFYTLVAWSFLVLLFGFLINLGVYSTLLSGVANLYTRPDSSIMTILPSPAKLIAQFGRNILNYIEIKNAVLMIFITLTPTFVFHTATVNLVSISNDFHHWCLSLWYDTESRIRQYEAPGYILLLVLYILAINTIS